MVKLGNVLRVKCENITALPDCYLPAGTRKLCFLVIRLISVFSKLKKIFVSVHDIHPLKYFVFVVCCFCLCLFSIGVCVCVCMWVGVGECMYGVGGIGVCGGACVRGVRVRFCCCCCCFVFFLVVSVNLFFIQEQTVPKHNCQYWDSLGR